MATSHIALNDGIRLSSILFFFIVGLSFTNAQSLTADEELKKGERYGDFSMPDSALYHLYRADSLYGIAENWEQQMKSKALLIEKFYSNRDFKKAKNHVDQAITFAKEKEGNHDASLGSVYLIKGMIDFLYGQPVDTAFVQLQIGFDLFESGEVLDEKAWLFYHFKAIIFYYSGQTQKCREAALQSLEKIATSSSKDKAGAMVIHNLLGVANRKERNYDAVAFHYEQAIKEIEAYEQAEPRYRADSDKGVLYHNLGNLFYEIREYEKSFLYLKRALALNQKIYPEGHNRIGFSHFSLGGLFHYQKKYKEAMIQFDEAEKIFNLPPRDPLNISAVYHNKGTTYTALLEYDKALLSYNEALRLREETPGMDPVLQAETLLELGELYRKRHELEKSERNSKKSVELYRSSLGEKNGEVAHALFSLGLVLLSSEKYERALEVFHSSLYSNTKSDDSDLSLEALPPLNEAVFFPDIYIAAIAGKGKALYRLSIQSQDKEQLELAYQHFIRSDEMIRINRRQFDQTKDQIAFNNRIHDIYQIAVDVAYALYEKDPKPAYIEKAIQFSEQSKTQALLATLTKNTVLHYPGISDVILKREETLRNKVNHLKEELDLAATTNHEDTSHQRMEQQLFEWTSQYSQLLDTLKKSSPSYYKWVYKNDGFDTKAVQQQLLGKGQQLVEYFISLNQIHIFHLSNNHFSWHTSPLPKDLKGEITDYLSAIHDQHILQFSGQSVSKSQQVKADQTYAHLGQSLYQLLIQPLAEKDLSSTLIIIPDGVLGNLPFETLLTNTPSEIGSYHSYPYLINRHQISYAYSIDLLLQLQKKQRTTAPHQEWLAFAPAFADCQQFAEKTSAQTLRSQSFGPLQNKAEVLSIQEIIGGKVLLKKEASLDNFVELSPQYAFLHIASHGKANQQNPDWSMIGLSSKGSEDCLFDTLRASYIANLSLPAELVVLSACEGAIGELQNGEGVQSLAMAFTYAGAQSLCSTLWSVQDKAMREMMTSFYTHLDQGLAKDAALRKAKLTYISSHDNSLAHPFYWAAPILIGDAKAVSFNSSSYLLYGFLLIGLLFSFLLLFFKRKKS